MRIIWKVITLFLSAFIFTALFFHVPILAETPEGEYLGVLKSGESISSRDIAYGVYKISPTCIKADGGWCTNCSSGNSLTTMSGQRVNSTYSILVDGYSVFDYCSPSAGEGIIDLSQYSDKDATISLPNEYTVKQKIACVGGTYANGQSKESCGYSYYYTIKVSGSLQLYGYDKKPKIVSNPQSISTGTDNSVSFSVVADKTVGYRWQMLVNGAFCDLKDGTDSNSISYSGCNSPSLTVSNTRCSINGTSFRCILIGEKGDEVASEAASLSITDTSSPKVSVSFSPTGNTTGSVTITINASDPDSGLLKTPYYYLNSEHSENSFKVSDNGTYEIKVSDNAGNTTTTSVTVSNIRSSIPDSPSPSPSPAAVITPTPTPTPMLTPAVIPTVQPTVKPTVSPTFNKKDDNKGDTKKDETKNDNKKSDANKTLLNEKKVNKNGCSDKNYDLNLKDEDNKSNENVDNEIMLSEAPTKIVNLEETEKISKKSIILMTVGLLILLILLLLAMIFPVRIETCDELGTWHFCTIRMVSISSGYVLKVGLLLEDFDSLRLHFGGLFMMIAKGRELKIMLETGEEIIIDEIEQNLVVEYSQARRG